MLLTLTYHLETVASQLHEIQGHINAINTVKPHLNPLAPISRLPPELLGEIFMCNMALHMADSSFHRPHWQRVSRVCHYWREVAIRCPHLWMHVNFVGNRPPPYHFPAILERSGQLDLFVQLNFPLAHEQFVQEQIHRITGLQLRLSDASDDGHVQTLLSRASALRRLELDGRSPSPPKFNRSNRYSEIAYRHQDYQLIEVLRHLEVLVLREIGLSWMRKLHHPHMKVLRIEFDRFPAHGVGRLNFFLEALKGMPLLEVLVMHRFLPEIPFVTPSDHPVVRLEHLRYLSLTTDTFGCANFMSYLDVPPNMSIRLCADIMVTPSSLMQYQRYKWNTLYHTQHLVLARTEFSFYPITERPIRSLDASPWVLNVPDFAQYACRLTVDGIPSMLENTDARFLRMFEVLDFSQVIKLTMPDFWIPREDERKKPLVSALARLSEVRILELPYWSEDVFKLDVLAPPSYDADDVERGGKPPLFPQLEELVLRCPTTPELGNKEDVIVTLLKRRRKCGFGIGTVKITSPHVRYDSRAVEMQKRIQDANRNALS